jgi:hypothetical protein
VHRLQVGQHLAGVEGVGERVDDRDAAGTASASMRSWPKVRITTAST